MQNILIGNICANAPLLKERRYFPFVVVPSGKINKEGSYLPSMIKLHLCLINSIELSLYDYSSL